MAIKLIQSQHSGTIPCGLGIYENIDMVPKIGEDIADNMTLVVNHANGRNNEIYSTVRTKTTNSYSNTNKMVDIKTLMRYPEAIRVAGTNSARPDVYITRIDQDITPTTDTPTTLHRANTVVSMKRL